MKIHEYQAKEVLRKYGVPVPEGKPADTPSEAGEIARDLGEGAVVVKAQIHAGGRGKGGGIKLAQNPDEAEEAASRILGMTLVTAQTGPDGRIVRKLLIEKGVDISLELYAGITLDRTTSRSVLMVSRAGGVEIEEVARTQPEAIIKCSIDPLTGLQAHQARRLAFELGFDGKTALKLAGFFIGLDRACACSDASLAEINPLVLTESGEFLALDAKINFDDNALFRHPDLAEMRDLDEEEPLEVEANKYDLNYIKLDGNVGCMVNGAGLAMATMDIIMQAGAMPANFLDVGGGASEESVTNGFRILLSDPKVEAILINIFGGIVRCDRVARGIVEATAKVELNRPMAVRLQGTNSEEARKLLEESDLDILTASSFQEAAQKVVQSLGSPKEAV
jgi:succinyl-CoA synthetase beta subunit